MAKEEILYARPLRRALSDQDRSIIDQLIDQNMHHSPVAVRREWHPHEPALRIHTALVSWLISFTNDRLVLRQRVTLAGRLLDTRKNRKKLLDLVHTLVEELDL